ncbi:hypothetical protein QR680_016184 [Steinernema hermaphroditum]|uniref:TIL domain-containing protein n=1 Tax=Steinernema hermaphroditum TaxID=289476 RepID=A0AA39LM66_9BILA|nr:hypothetical protein QR680_016184 [Steinernema hermaphroditum]
MLQIFILTGLLTVSALGSKLPSFCLPVCPPNEVYLKCGVCEGTCSDPDPINTYECRPAGCYCLNCQGYVRDANGICISKYECPICPATTEFPTESTLYPTESTMYPTESTEYPIEPIHYRKGTH